VKFRAYLPWCVGSFRLWVLYTRGGSPQYALDRGLNEPESHSGHSDEE